MRTFGGVSNEVSAAGTSHTKWRENRSHFTSQGTKYYSFSMRLNPDRSLPTVRRGTYVNGVVPSPLRCVSAMEQKLHYKARAILSMSTWNIEI